MLAADARDVYFYLGHIESQFRVFPKPLANVDEHLQGSFESGVNVRVIAFQKLSPARADDVRAPGPTWGAETDCIVPFPSHHLVDLR